jgi:hypothetical protein
METALAGKPVELSGRGIEGEPAGGESLAAGLARLDRWTGSSSWFDGWPTPPKTNETSAQLRVNANPLPVLAPAGDMRKVEEAVEPAVEANQPLASPELVLGEPPSMGLVEEEQTEVEEPADTGADSIPAVMVEVAAAPASVPAPHRFSVRWPNARHGFEPDIPSVDVRQEGTGDEDAAPAATDRAVHQLSFPRTVWRTNGDAAIEPSAASPEIRQTVTAPVEMTVASGEVPQGPTEPGPALPAAPSNPLSGRLDGGFEPAPDAKPAPMHVGRAELTPSVSAAQPSAGHGAESEDADGAPAVFEAVVGPPKTAPGQSQPATASALKDLATAQSAGEPVNRRLDNGSKAGSDASGARPDRGRSDSRIPASEGRGEVQESTPDISVDEPQAEGPAMHARPVAAATGNDAGASGQSGQAAYPAVATLNAESVRRQVEVDAGPQPGTPAAEPPASATDADAVTASGPLREVSLKVEDASGATVHLKFTERRGEVHVVTRTADADLSRELAGGLPELRKSLEDGGMAADVWVSSGEPHQVQDKVRVESQAGSDTGSRSGPESDRQSRDGSRPGGNSAKWMDVIEDSLDGISRGGIR